MSAVRGTPAGAVRKLRAPPKKVVGPTHFVEINGRLVLVPISLTAVGASAEVFTAARSRPVLPLSGWGMAEAVFSATPLGAVIQFFEGGNIHLSVTTESLHSATTRSLRSRGYLLFWNKAVAEFLDGFKFRHEYRGAGSLQRATYTIGELEQIVLELESIFNPLPGFFREFTEAEFGLFRKKDKSQVITFIGPNSQANHSRGGMRGGSAGRNRAGAYWGLGQFNSLDRTPEWRRVTALANQAGYSLAPLERSGPVDQLVAIYLYAVLNQDGLVRNKLPVTIATLYGCHNQGLRGFFNYVSSGRLVGNQGTVSKGAELLRLAKRQIG